jgi:hypothetical protein
MKPAVFIQANDKQMLGARVAAHALRRNSRQPGAFDIRIMRVEDMAALHNRHGQSYLREGKAAVWDNGNLQSFTPVRFLPPQLAGYQGRAVVIDPDVFALADVMDLLTMDMGDKSVFARKITGDAVRGDYWATSVMLLDCAKLTHWQWEENIDEMFSFKRDYRDWTSLMLEPQHSIGILEDAWNHYDRLDGSTKMLHNTGRLTQPWKTGLPIDFTYDKRARIDRVAGLVPREWMRRIKFAVTGRAYLPPGFYQPHPDRRQEALFFQLLRECVENGEITLPELETEIAAQHIRKDALKLLAAA